MELPEGGLLGRTAARIRRIREMHISQHASYAGYFTVLALFPGLVLTLALLRYTSLDTGDLMELLSGYLPRALLEPVERLVIQTYAASDAALVSVSAVGTLWSASKGVYGILRGLNAIYGLEERRGWLHTRAISMGYTFLFLGALMLSLVLNVFGEALLAWIPVGGWLWRLLSGIIGFRALLMLAVQTALFAATFRILPAHRGPLRAQLTGALLASLGWQIFSELFSLYVEHMSGYAGIYGSVYAMALGLLWLYCCLCILFFGAALNRLLAEGRGTAP